MPRVLFIIDSDPRTSGRAAEAIRIAAGVGAWQRVEVTLYLRGPAVLALGETTDDLVDGESIARSLSSIGGWGRAIYVQASAPSLDQLGNATVAMVPMDDAAMAMHLRTCTYTVRY